MRLPHISAVVLLGLLVGCEHAGSPLSPTPEKRLQGTYTLTASTSRSCAFEGSWTFRADITQSGRDLVVNLWKPNGDVLCIGQYDACLTWFNGQDNADGVLFFPDADNTLIRLAQFSVVFGISERDLSARTGHAFGQYLDGRIEALYDGAVTLREPFRECYAPDHKLTFVRW